MEHGASRVRGEWTGGEGVCVMVARVEVLLIFQPSAGFLVVDRSPLSPLFFSGVSVGLGNK